MKIRLTPGERMVDDIIHVTGVAIGLIAVIAMLIAAARSLPAASTACLAIYGVAVVTMLGCSAAYHMAPAMHWKEWLRRLDHAAIFLKIAGTYTPFAAIKIGDAGGLALLGSVWLVALLGSAGKLLLASTWDRLAVLLYLLLGWSGVVMVEVLGSRGDINHAYLARDRRRTLYRRGCLSPVALIAIPEGGLAHLCAGRDCLPFWRGYERSLCLTAVAHFTTAHEANIFVRAKPKLAARASYLPCLLAVPAALQ